jgi:hypothetical protein
MRFLVQAANGLGAVGMDTADGDGYHVFPAGADTAKVALSTSAPQTGSPLGVTATVTDGASPVAGRTVRFTVARGGSELFEYAAESAADGTVVLQLPTGQKLPSGRLQVTADVIGVTGQPVDTARTEVVIGGATFALSPSGMTTRAGTAFPAGMPLRATLTDARGPVAHVPVTFTLPGGSPGATFAGGTTSATVQTDDNGVALAPQMTAKPAVGTFVVTVSAEGATANTEPMAAQYGFGSFADPISNTGTTTRNASANLPLVVSGLMADGSKIPDATAKGLVAAGRVQIRWRVAGSTGPWSADTTLAVYDSKQHAFTADLKAPRLGWTPGKTYTVAIRILPGPGDVRPAGDDVVSGSFDLGSSAFTLRVT